jgi:hypothetical protein
MGKYRFEVGQKVKIRGGKSSSVDCKENKGKVVTIKSLCKFTWAYELEELDGLWQDSCFEAI